MNDADLEMIELAERGNQAAAGVCGICEEPLYPLLPKWAGTYGPRYTATQAAEAVGPVDAQVPYHVACIEEGTR